MFSELIASIKEHPTVSGFMSTLTTGGFSLIGLLTDDLTVKMIASVGGILGIVLAGMSIYHKNLQIKNEKHHGAN